MGTDPATVATELCDICNLPISRRAYFDSIPGLFVHRSCSALRDAEDNEYEVCLPTERLDGRWT